ncbi:MAG: nuclear transport factor 2 family protein [Cyclobacteriaceae bacterium]|nr:MAG: nuclear transport factor 2 family protein [Cyclobacteriaceae bacterium]
MIKIIILFLLPVTLLAQRNRAEESAIRQVMHNQQEAWNRADIEAFMEGYWKSDSLKFIGRNGITYGWQTTLDNYKKSYPTPEAMGKLTFSILTLDILSETSAFMIGRWHLKRTNDEPGGHFTLLWHKINGKWVIIADHTS